MNTKLANSNDKAINKKIASMEKTIKVNIHIYFHRLRYALMLIFYLRKELKDLNTTMETRMSLIEKNYKKQISVSFMHLCYVF